MMSAPERTRSDLALSTPARRGRPRTLGKLVFDHKDKEKEICDLLFRNMYYRCEACGQKLRGGFFSNASVETPIWHWLASLLQSSSRLEAQRAFRKASVARREKNEKEFAVEMFDGSCACSLLGKLAGTRDLALS